MNTGQKIKQYCEAQKMTISAFSKMCGITEMSIHVWSRGKTEPSIKCLRKIAAATGTDVSYWIGEVAA